MNGTMFDTLRNSLCSTSVSEKTKFKKSEFLVYGANLSGFEVANLCRLPIYSTLKLVGVTHVCLATTD